MPSLESEPTRLCNKCKLIKPHSQMRTRNNRPCGVDSVCRACDNLAQQARRAANPGLDQNKEAVRRKRIADMTEEEKATYDQNKRERARFLKFGITQEEIVQRLKDQNGCAICHTTEPNGKGWQVDHDHHCCPSNKKTCGKCTRGILCSECNLGLGKFRDDIVRLKSAITYLDQEAS